MFSADDGGDQAGNIAWLPWARWEAAENTRGNPRKIIDKVGQTFVFIFVYCTYWYLKIPAKLFVFTSSSRILS